MESLKLKKGPIILPLALLAVVLVVYTLLNLRTVTAADNLSVGQQYLNDLNYSGAVAAFTRAIELDPENRDARIGLAEAYAGTGEYEFAQEVLSDLVYRDQPDEDATRTMADLLVKSGQPAKAIPLVQTLIEITDKDAYYDFLSELLEQLYAAKRSLAVGTDHVLEIRSGQLYGRGSNTMGQLGSDPASVNEVPTFTQLSFAGEAVKAICAGRTSFVVDAAGQLWTAGENRWGQMGLGYAVTSPEGGWQQIPTSHAVADVAGTTGRLLVLLTDGSLWTAGASGSQTLAYVDQFPVVISLAANQQQAVILTVDGQLYRSDSRYPDQWTPVASDVCDFSLSDSDLCWVSSTNGLNWQGSRLQLPDDWYSSETWEYRADVTVTRFAMVNGYGLLLASDGSLRALPGNGLCREIQTGSPAVALYPQGSALVVEFEDGTAQFLTASNPDLQPLDTF